MTGTIELDPDGQTLQIRFPYNPSLVEDVKSIPGRRWDRNGKLWRVPAGQVENTMAILMRHGFVMSADVSSLLAGTQGTRPVAEPPADATDTGEEAGPDALSISSLNEKVRAAVQVGFPEAVWVIGEISDFDKNQDRQHIFFTLVEKKGERIEAQVSVAMFERTAKMLRARLGNLPEPMTLADGIEVRVQVKVDVYPRNGRYQLIIEDIDPTFTLGKLALGREEILRELREKGLDEKNKGIPLPQPALRIGVLASHDSDGWNDFLATIKSSGIGFALTSYNVRVQGELLRPSVLQGLRWFADRSQEFDVLCIVRGGGSRTDLAWFDDRDVALAVANHPLKILCGIGHQRDQSVLDLITHSEKTPTAVAEYLVAEVQRTREILADLTRSFVDLVRRYLRAEDRRLSESGHRLRHRVQGALIFERERLLQASRRIGQSTRATLQFEHERLGTARRRIAHSVRAALRAERERLAYRGPQLQRACRRQLEQAHAALANHTTRCRLLDPKKVLARGYTLARTEDGKIVTDTADLAAGDALRIEFRDGTARTTIDSLTLQQPDQGRD